jgi:dTMP kinase
MPQGGPKPRRGPFITFEGGDGVGKTTQIQLLAERLRSAGRNVVATREPGGSPGAEAIRDLIVNGAVERWSPMAEALLMFAARADHLERTINPARAEGAVVICDRFSDSTLAYQGIAGSLGQDAVLRLHELVVGDDGPDLTFILDVPEGVGLARAAGRGRESRFEAKGADYQRRVREAFLEIARQNRERCFVIDGSRPIDVCADEIAGLVRRRLTNG